MRPAMIFAAGLGTRMGDLTRETPKPMLKLAGQPMIDHAIDLLKDADARPLVANTHYLADRIAPHLHARGVITFHEDPILETGGGLRNALSDLGSSPVITINPDAAWLGPNPVRLLLDAWQNHMHALLVLIPASRASGTASKGDFSLESGEIRRNGPWIYGGLQLIRTDWLGEIEGDVFSLNAYWDLLAATGPIHGIEYPGDWHDIGTPEGLALAEKRLSDV